MFPHCRQLQQFKIINEHYDVNVFGYGSMHLYDAGMCFIDNVLDNNPNYRFIDWMSTGFLAIYMGIKIYIECCFPDIFFCLIAYFHLENYYLIYPQFAILIY